VTPRAPALIDEAPADRDEIATIEVVASLATTGQPRACGQQQKVSHRVFLFTGAEAETTPETNIATTRRKLQVKT
jgi:hypothetical protein